MINQTNMDCAVKIFGKIAPFNIKTIIRADTPLEGIVHEMMPMCGVVPDGQDAPVIIQNVVSTENAQGENAFNATIEEAVNVIADVTVNRMETIRGLVLPMISQAVERANDALSTIELADFSIQSYFLADIHDNAFIHEMMENFASATYQEVSMLRGFGARTEGELMELVKTGNPLVDQQLAKMLANHPEGWIVDVYDFFFGRSPYKVYQGHVSFPEMDKLVVGMMLVNAVLESPPEDYPASLSAYERETVFLLGQIAGALKETHERWDRLRTNGVVVLSWPIASDVPSEPEQAIINVIGDNYNNFIGAGGSPELIIGAAVSNRPYNAEDLLENKDTYLQAYESYRVRYETNKTKSMGTLMRNALGTSLTESVRLLPKDMFPEGLSDHDAPGVMLTHLGYYSDIEISEKTYQVAREIVSKVLFPDYDPLAVLKGIDEEMEKREIEPRVAATLVVVDDILDHLLSQVIIE